MRLVHPFVTLLLAAVVAGCRDRAAPIPAVDPQVAGVRIRFPSGAPQLGALTVEPVSGGGSDSTRLFGRLTWDEDVTVRVFTPFAGRVRRVLVDVGRHVEKGEALAEVESSEFGQAQSDARAASGAELLARRNLSRLRELYDHGAAPWKDVEAAIAESARAGAEDSRARQRLAAYGVATDSVTGVFLLRTPIAGTITERNLTPGQEIRPDQMLANAPALFSPLFVVSDPTRLWIRLDATESDLTCLRTGEIFHFTTGAFPDRKFAARLDVVSESIDPVTHTVLARGTVENPDRRLKAEMFVTADLPAAPTRDVSVPSPAVFLKGDRHFVFVEERPGTFVRRQVEVRSEEDTRVLVSAGVRAGERVVTDGCVMLEELLD